jgi:hypothetical protein
LKGLQLKPLLIETQHGLGDNIYHRAFVKAMTSMYEVYLKTPFTEVYEDLPVKFVKQQSNLRTQAKNIAKSECKFHELPPHCPTIQPRYTGSQLERMSMIEGLTATYHCAPKAFDLPKFKSKIKSDKPICVVRPVTLRKEWNAASRNPDPRHVYQVIEWLRKTHYIVSVADLEDGTEHALKPLPYADLTLHKGELTTKELLGLISEADIVVGGVGFVVPACIAYGTKLFCILGGNGAYNAPEKITHSSMDLSKIYFAKPDNYCGCNAAHHECDKRITNLKGMFDGFIQRNK